MSDPNPNGYSPADTVNLRLLYDVIHEFNSTLDLEVVLGKVMSLTIQALGAARGSVFVIDAKGEVVKHILARKHLPPDVQTHVIEVVMKRGAAGWVYHHRESAVIKNVLTDHRWHSFPDDVPPVRSAVVAPLIRRGEVTGIVSVEDYEAAAFGSKELALMEAIAAQAAIAIENAWLFAQVVNERDTVTAILNSSEDAILVVNGEDQKIKLVNPRASELLGVGEDEAIGRQLRDVFPSLPLVNLLGYAIEGEPIEAEIKVNGRRRTYVVVAKTIPQVGQVLAFHDITHFVELDNLKSEFVATVSHDLRGPLGIIMGYGTLLADESVTPEERKTFAAEIQSSARQMQSLVENLLDLAQIEAGVDSAEDDCPLPLIVAELVEQYQAQAKEKGIHLSADLPKGLPSITANRLRITQAIGNLVSNALKYTSQGGKVSIAVKEWNGSLRIVVTDDGEGIATEDLPKLFQKFSRVGNAEIQRIAGTGLGLAIVRSVAESYGGRVWVKSKLGRGSSFYVEFPRRRSSNSRH